MSLWFPAHTHSHFSPLDGMSPVPQLVHRAHEYGAPGFGLTDHGNMGGTVQLYQTCKQYDMKPFPGIELYLLDPEYDGDLKDAGSVGRFHLGLLALTERGYKGLVGLTTATHTRPRFSRFPRATLSDLIQFGQDYGKDVALTTGCFFGLAQQYLVNRGEKQALGVLRMYANAFPNTFVEVQNHNIEHTPELDGAFEMTHDRDIVGRLVNMADQLGLPVMATQDSHYCDQNEKQAHALMKRMVYGGKEDEFPGDSFHLASGEWVGEHYEPKVWDRVEQASEHLLNLNKVRIPPLDKFKVHVPDVGRKNPLKFIRDKCMSALKRYLKRMGWDRKLREYLDRLDMELGVVEQLDMAAYFIIWYDFVAWCRKEKIAIEARGSANGSLFVFLLGVTQIDPLKWDNLLFDRFLSTDRIKPPDVDMDIEDQHRDRAIAYLFSLFEAARIGTWGKLGARADDDRGSVMVSWLMSKRRESQAIAKEYADRRAARGEKPWTKGAIEDYGKRIFYKTYGNVETIEDVRQHSEEDYWDLRELARMDSVHKGTGVHAGGVLLSSNEVKISDYVPMMLIASSDTVATQFHMDDVEALGLLKMDLLGQVTLSVMKKAQEMIGRDDPCDFTWIPENDQHALRLLRTGRTDTGIFHFEGYTKAKGGRELGIRSVRDTILAQGLYMPGAMDTGQKDLYLRRRRNKHERDSVQYIHPIFEAGLKETYGAVIFQEQVINIMRGLGMSIAGVNKFFKVVKDSGKGAVARNRVRMAEVRKEFDDLCHKAGIADVNAAWEQTAGFVAYGFNKAHATGYGLRSYRCAYLKAHYPLEFMTALLQCWAGTKKETLYIREARRMEIRVLPPAINVSGATWTRDERANAIRKGLVSVKGIGVAGARELEEKAPFSSVLDMAERVSGRAVSGGNQFKKDRTYTGTMKTLHEIGALDILLEQEREAKLGRVNGRTVVPKRKRKLAA